MWTRVLQWLLQKIAFNYLDDVVKYITRYFADLKKKAAEESSKKKLDEVINNADSTAEDKAKAYEEYINKK